MVKRLQDIAYPTINEVWGSDEAYITSLQMKEIISSVRWRFGINAEEGSDFHSLFNSIYFLDQWETPENIAGLLIENGVKP